VELITVQGAITQTAHFITKEENYLLSQWHLQVTDSALCHKAYQKCGPAYLYVNFGPHKHHSNVQATSQDVSSVHVEESQLMGSINMCIICTHYVAQCWKQVPTIIWNYSNNDGETGTGGNFRLSTAGPRHIRTAHVITQPHKLHSQIVGLVTAAMYQVPSLTCSFVYGLGLQTGARHPQ